jgi:hypothetical protein
MSFVDDDIEDNIDDVSLLDYDDPSEVPLQMLLDEVGGIHRDLEYDREHSAYVARWLLDYATLEEFGFAAAVYSLQLADAKIAIKAGMIFLSEALTQDAVERTLSVAPPVYSYMPNLELGDEYHEYLCPRHGPLRRRKGVWKKDVAPCFCRYEMDFLIMPFCEARVQKSEVTPEMEEVFMRQAKAIFEIGKTFGGTPEVKTLMRLNGQIVFVDFGDVCDMDGLNFRPRVR